MAIWGFNFPSELYLGPSSNMLLPELRDTFMKEQKDRQVLFVSCMFSSSRGSPSWLVTLAGHSVPTDPAPRILVPTFCLRLYPFLRFS